MKNSGSRSLKRRVGELARGLGRSFLSKRSSPTNAEQSDGRDTTEIWDLRKVVSAQSERQNEMIRTSVVTIQ